MRAAKYCILLYKHLFPYQNNCFEMFEVLTMHLMVNAAWVTTQFYKCARECLLHSALPSSTKLSVIHGMRQAGWTIECAFMHKGVAPLLFMLSAEEVK